MPDWVTSYVDIAGDEKSIVGISERIAANDGEFSFDWFPLPPSAESFFTNLDIETAQSIWATEILVREPSRLVISFQTAWAPVESYFFEAIEHAGFSVSALSIDEDGIEQRFNDSPE